MPASSRATVTGTRQPLVEFAALQSVVCGDVPGLFGLPSSHRCLVVSDGPWWCSTVTVAARLAMSGSSSRELRVSFRVLQQSSARALARPCSSPGVLALIATSIRGVHMHRTSQARCRSARSVSHALDGLLLLVPRASISLRYRVQGSRFRGLLPPAWPYHLVGGHHPHVVGAIRLPVARRQRASRRPQGRSSPESAVSDGLIRPTVTRVPSCFSTPSGLSPEILVVPSHVLRSRPFGAVLRVPRAENPQRIVDP